MMPPPSAQDVARFRALIAARLGLQIDETRLDALADVLRVRSAACGGILSYDDYLDRFAGNGMRHDELSLLAHELTVTETYFFRNADQFSALTEVALPRRLAARAPQSAGPVRILSAGCASGEEPYSLAIIVRECFPHAASLIAITALDINRQALDKAERGRYSNWSLRDTSAQLRDAWFKPEGNAFELDPEIRRSVAFVEGNLAQEDPGFWQPMRFDIVFCRNVLMYFSATQARAAVARIAISLKPGGYLFLGHAETLRGLSSDFHLCHTHGTFYYQRKDDLAGEQPAETVRMEYPRPAIAPGDTSWIDTIRRASERISALSNISPATAPEATVAGSAPTPPDLAGAFESLHRERFAEVLDHIGELPAEQARDADVLLLKAVSLSHSGALEQAQETCRELLACDELNAGAHYVLAVCREAAGDVQGAIEQDQVAAYLDPAFAMPHMHMGLLARRQGDRDTALRALTQALGLLQQEDAARILLFGGGFKREALIAMCRAHCDAL
jgi:chemotaxis protein methyltransferase CheR